MSFPNGIAKFPIGTAVWLLQIGPVFSNQGIITISQRIYFKLGNLFQIGAKHISVNSYIFLKHFDFHAICLFFS